ncbi:hypothetical protein [Polaromonas glacialis]|uniref:hypothetical protein n=1 Tax=Polaromonas glacialis TaxID=866564 RepID=UPI0012EB08DC|nr:hypothetical protein [Polaromonas glacialis]
MDMAVFPVFSSWHIIRALAPGSRSGHPGKKFRIQIGSGKKSSQPVPWHEDAQNFWQAGWANIWNAVLAVRWPSPVEFPLAQRGPVPEVLLSRLPEKTGLYPKN